MYLMTENLPHYIEWLKFCINNILKTVLKKFVIPTVFVIQNFDHTVYTNNANICPDGLEHDYIIFTL